MADFIVISFLVTFGALILLIGGFTAFAAAAEPLDRGDHPYDPMAILTGRTTPPLASTPPQSDAASLAA